METSAFSCEIVNLRLLAQPARNSLPVFKFNPSSPVRLQCRYHNTIKTTIKLIKEQDVCVCVCLGMGG